MKKAFILIALLYATPAFACSGMWVAWAMSADAIIPIDAFDEKAECQAKAARLNATSEAIPSGILVVCLPDSIDPRRPAERT